MIAPSTGELDRFEREVAVFARTPVSRPWLVCRWVSDGRRWLRGTDDDVWNYLRDATGIGTHAPLKDRNAVNALIKVLRERGLARGTNPGDDTGTEQGTTPPGAGEAVRSHEGEAREYRSQ